MAFRIIQNELNICKTTETLFQNSARTADMERIELLIHQGFITENA